MVLFYAPGSASPRPAIVCEVGDECVSLEVFGVDPRDVGARFPRYVKHESVAAEGEMRWAWPTITTRPVP